MSFRIEQKIPASVFQGNEYIQQIIQRGGRRLFPSRIVRSTYFDNNTLEMYHDSEEGLLPRKKYRIRTYPSEDTERYTLETKISSVEGRFKTTELIDVTENHELLRRGIFDVAVGHVIQSLIVQYERQYYTLDDIRITFDTDIKYWNPRSINGACANDPLGVIELKAPFGESQQKLDAILSSQRARFSKYCRGIQYTHQF